MIKTKPQHTLFVLPLIIFLMTACNFGDVDLSGGGGLSSTEEPAMETASPTPEDTPTPEPP
ncbi:MAG TPA: hypothetical protein VJ972_04120, partial [Anaerolineales bacterium]|nr:hypothetical protein [Anaerolineales bacterium]